METMENHHYRTQSDADSQTSQSESFYSPLRLESPFHSDDPNQPPEEINTSPSKPPSPGIFSVSKFLPPLRYTNHQQKLTRQKSELISLPPPPPPPPMFSLSVNEAAARRTQKMALAHKGRPGIGSAGAGGGTTGGGIGSAGGGTGEDLEGGRVVTEKRRQERLTRPAVAVAPPTSPGKGRGTMVKKMELWFRVLEIIGCVISFSIMASDKNQGWTGDSFDRYKEYRYCVAVNALGFAYATFQACCATYKLVTEKQSHILGCYFDFAMDQTISYLLISASSAAATRVDDWVSNWGKDQFTEKATASITTSFLAFALFAVSSLLSGHNLCSHN
ncbi:CASP-like protein 4A3 [Impatiens glandulifera]|uniref:CASP-like protein 4A3 n=1 Tax=Impatiens glandulifera TaxID=253017 RepID=UPI001FB04F73|nr:CASP-like protein 4A3 [Impatiens glandulifera]